MITNLSEDEIIKIAFEYYLDGSPVGGDIEPHGAPAFSLGEEIKLSFPPKHFPENSDISKFSTEISVTLKNGETARCSPVLSIKAEWKKEYPYKLTGNSKKRFLLE